MERQHYQIEKELTTTMKVSMVAGFIAVVFFFSYKFFTMI